MNQVRDIQHGFKRCMAVCPDGTACCLNGRIPHERHICSRPKCKCHSAERYEREAHQEKVEVQA